VETQTNFKLLYEKNIVVLSGILFCAGISSVIAQTNTIADWTFESVSILAQTNTPADGNVLPIAADVGSGSLTGHHATAVGSEFSTPSGNGSSKALSANNWLANDYWQAQVSTLTYANLIVVWDQTASATGPKNWALQYSTDGTAFTSFFTYTVPAATAWNPSTAATTTSYNVDLTSVLSLDNLSAAYFRLVDTSAATGGAVNGGNVGTSGTGRIDNFAVLSVPEPTSLALAALGGFAVLGLSIFKKRN